MNDKENLEEIQNFVEQYKTDEPPIRVAQVAAIEAMDVFLRSWQQGLDNISVRAALKETQRMLEILNAFQGRLAIIDCQINPDPDVF